MRKWFKFLSSLVLIPATRWYLRKERTFRYRDTNVLVSPGVFHPGLFSSSTLLLDHVLSLPLRSKTLLELGCGTGLISTMCAKAGAHVTAVDISSKAIENTTRNTSQFKVEILKSDLFESLRGRKFDFIVINPPYYAKPVREDHEYAWNCGENFEYFHSLFQDLANHLTPAGRVFMVLTKGCDLQSIFNIGRQNDFAFALIKEKNVVFDEKDYLFEITASQSILT